MSAMLPLLLVFVLRAAAAVDFNYHHYPEMTSLLRQMNAEYPHLTRLYSIGKSMQGRELWVLLLTSDPTQEPLLKPNVKLVGNMHGNEPVGRELLLHLISDLLEGYAQGEATSTWTLDSMRLHIMPTMNPDGFEAAQEGKCSGVVGRGNAAGVDLNRNFPDFLSNTAASAQPETRAIMDWVRRTQFVLSGNFHGGALVASYPFDNLPPGSQRGASLTPDDDVFRWLANTYSFNHRNMHLGTACRDGTQPFINGTTNGAAWYALQGGMQDYNYVWGGCMEITLEISCCKYPQRHLLPQFWEDNKHSLKTYLQAAHQGVWGVVSDVENGRPVSNASVKIEGRRFGSKTTGRGEFWRILRPGHYTLTVSAPGYESASLPVSVAKGVIVQNVSLQASHQPRSEPTLLTGGGGRSPFVWPQPYMVLVVMVQLLWWWRACVVVEG